MRKRFAKLLLEKVEGQFPRLQKIFADGCYDGKDFITAVKEDYQLDWEVVKRTQEKGFKVLPSAMDSGKKSRLVDTLSPVNY